MKVTVVPLDRAGLPALLQMWRGYQEFYQVNEIDDRRNREHIERILTSGVGRSLIDQALELARQEGIRYVRWSTAASNADAQRLYDSYATPTLWKMYSVDV